MKNILSVVIILSAVTIIFTARTQASKTYNWKKLNITFVSSEKLEDDNKSSSNYLLYSDNVAIELSILEGMDGIGGLKGSLESYAKSFYKKTTPAVEVSDKTKNIKRATLTAQDGMKKYAVGMFCYPNNTNHFICIIEYKDGFLNEANSILQSITLNGKQFAFEDNEERRSVDNKNNSNNVINKNNKPKPVYDKVKIVLYGNPECTNTINVRSRLDQENIIYSFHDSMNIPKYHDEMDSFLKRYGYFREKKFPVSIVGAFVFMASESDDQSIINLTRQGDKTTVYGNSQGSSKRLKSQLDAARINYRYIDLDKHPEKMKQLEEELADKQSILYPIAVINNTMVYNESLKFIDEIIAIAKGEKK